MTKTLRKPLIISLLLHLLLVINVSGVLFIYRPKAEDRPYVYTPSYLYHPKMVMPPMPQSHMVQHKQSHVAAQKTVPTARDGIEKPVPIHQIRSENQPQEMNPNQLYQLKPLQYSPHSEPPDEKSDTKVNIPLLNLIHEAVASRLVYPKAAIDFNESGTVKIGFVIYPNGELTDVTLVQSSGSDILDNAALTAVNTMWPVHGVDKYLTKPRYIAGYIVFRIESGPGGGSWDLNM